MFLYDTAVVFSTLPCRLLVRKKRLLQKNRKRCSTLGVVSYTVNEVTSPYDLTKVQIVGIEKKKNLVNFKIS